MDFVVVAADDDSSFIIGIRCGKIVFFLTLRCNTYAVYHDVVAAVVQAGEQTVPFALDEVDIDAELICDQLCNLYVVAHQLVVFIVIGPGGPGTLHGNRDAAPCLDLV